MQAREKKTKGFTLLELLVVIAILGILSATVYPNFSSWIKDRKVRQATEKIKNLISNINTQVQSGSYEFVQVRFIEDGSVTIFTSGIGMNSLASKKKDPDDDFNDKNTRCNINDSYWDDLGSDGESPGGVGLFMSDEIVINFDSETAAVCFSKDGSYYSKSGIESPLNICLRTNTVIKCSVKPGGEDPDMGQVGDVKEYIYRVRWTRFGSVSMDKWIARYTKEDVMIYGGWVQQ